MSEVPVWVERQFPSGIPVEMHPNLRARLAGVAARVLDVARGVPKEVLTRRVVDDKWSMQEHAGHLLDLEDLFSHRVDEFSAGADMLTAADMSNAKTERARHNDGDIEDIAERLAAARRALMAKLDGLETSDFAKTSVHPRLQQPMRLVDLMLFVAEHDDHHVAKMRELRREHRLL